MISDALIRRLSHLGVHFAVIKISFIRWKMEFVVFGYESVFCSCQQKCCLWSWFNVFFIINSIVRSTWVIFLHPLAESQTETFRSYMIHLKSKIVQPGNAAAFLEPTCSWASVSYIVARTACFCFPLFQHRTCCGTLWFLLFCMFLFYATLFISDVFFENWSDIFCDLINNRKFLFWMLHFGLSIFIAWHTSAVGMCRNVQ